MTFAVQILKYSNEAIYLNFRKFIRNALIVLCTWANRNDFRYSKR